MSVPVTPEKLPNPPRPVEQTGEGQQTEAVKEKLTPQKAKELRELHTKVSSKIQLEGEKFKEGVHADMKRLEDFLTKYEEELKAGKNTERELSDDELECIRKLNTALLSPEAKTLLSKGIEGFQKLLDMISKSLGDFDSEFLKDMLSADSIRKIPIFGPLLANMMKSVSESAPARLKFVKKAMEGKNLTLAPAAADDQKVKELGAQTSAIAGSYKIRADALLEKGQEKDPRYSFAREQQRNDKLFEDHVRASIDRLLGDDKFKLKDNKLPTIGSLIEPGKALVKDVTDETAKIQTEMKNLPPPQKPSEVVSGTPGAPGTSSPPAGGQSPGK